MPTGIEPAYSDGEPVRRARWTSRVLVAAI
jgi:hypothetical protein